MRRRDLWLRLRSLLAPRRVEQELDEELTFHIEMQMRKHLDAGLSPLEARRRAHAEFGSTAFVEDECRDARGMVLVDSVSRDVRYAMRGFRRTPTFALTVIGTIALGLGLNTAFFTIFNAYVLRPTVAVRDPHSLYLFTYANRAGRGHLFSWNEYQHFQQENPVFSDVFAGRKQLIAPVDGVVALGQLVTGNYFTALGVDAALGRTLSAGDMETPAGDAAIVLSHSFWRRHFGGDPATVGRTIRVRGYSCVVVGVAPEGFVGLDLVPHDYWAPITLANQLDDGPDLFGAAEPNRLEIIGRLKPGVSVRSAQAALTLWSRNLTASRPDGDRATSALLDPKGTSLPFRPAVAVVVLPILLAVGLVLVIACANVANLMLARAMARQREIGIRLSLGAARSRVILQLLTESLLLALPAAVAGYVLAHVVVQTCLQVLSATVPAQAVQYIRVMPLPLDARVFAFSVVIALGSAVLFGLAPALHATRGRVLPTSRGDFRYDIRPARVRNALVVIQIAASALLLICAAVLLRGANRIAAVDTGLRTEKVIELAVREQSRSVVLSSLASEPLVTTVAATRPAPPLAGTSFRISVVPSGASDLSRTLYRYASPAYFRVFGIPLSSGRTFTEDEAISGAPLVIVSQTAARRFWPAQSALGNVLHLVPDPTLPDGRIGRYREAVVVGVVEDVVAGYSDDDAERTSIYLPTSIWDRDTSLLVQVNADAELVRRRLDASLNTAAPGAVDEILPMHAFAQFRLYPFRVAYWVSTAVGLLALLLTISGIYGAFSYAVGQRTKEIGIRIALGATVGSITRLFLKQSVRLATIGLVLGVLLALAVSTLVRASLVVNTFDALGYAMAVIFVFLACMAAGYVPAIRAAGIDPIATLRFD